MKESVLLFLLGLSQVLSSFFLCIISSPPPIFHWNFQHQILAKKKKSKLNHKKITGSGPPPTTGDNISASNPFDDPVGPQRTPYQPHQQGSHPSYPPHSRPQGTFLFVCFYEIFVSNIHTHSHTHTFLFVYITTFTYIN